MKFSRIRAVYLTHSKTIVALVVASAFSIITTYATPPGSPYAAGATLDPACAPGSSNCTVLIIPDQTGNNGKYLTTNGSALSWGTVSGGGSNLIGSTSTLGVETWLGTDAAGHGTASDIYTVFVGIGTGNNATNANLSNFIGYQTGADATDAHDSNFIGNGAGVAATSAYLSNFLGVDTGLNATYATRSVFIGQSAGDSAGADVTYDGVNSDYYFDSVFMGFEAGKNATFADHSNFFGESAGLSATNANNANFFGQSAGLNATNAYESVFIGYRAGRSATNAASSTFLGSNAGLNASGAFGSFFASTNAGLNATNASESIFIGQQSGNGAIEANHSIFIGQSAGSSAANANNSIFIGNGAGVDDIVNNAASGSSILIGQNTSTGGFSNSIALGVYATNTASNQFMVGSTTRRIDNLVFNGGTGNTCSVNASTGITCSSDERLKTNITDIESALSDVMNLRTVTYNWKTDPDGKPMIGFIAQNLQQYFPQLVTENLDGMLSVNYAQITPVLVRAIQELNVKVGSLSDLTAPSTDGVIGLIRSWLADAGNTIEQLFAKQITTKELCLADDSGATTCINKSELDALIGGTQPQVVSDSAPAEQQEEVVPEQTDPEPEIVPEPEIAPDTPVADQEVVAE